MSRRSINRHLRIGNYELQVMKLISKVLIIGSIIGSCIAIIMLESLAQMINADTAVLATSIGWTGFAFIICFGTYTLMVNKNWERGHWISYLKPTVPSLLIASFTLPRLLEDIARNNASGVRVSFGQTASGFVTSKLPNLSLYAPTHTSKFIPRNPLIELGYKMPEIPDVWYTTSTVLYGPSIIFGVLFVGLCTGYYIRFRQGY